MTSGKKNKVSSAKTQAERGSPKNGVVPPKSRRFGQPNGNKQGHGFFKKEDTLRFKIEKMVNEMTDDELKAVLNDPKAKLGEKRLARLLLSETGKPESDWRVMEGIMNQAYGYPKQQVEQQNIELKSILPMENE